jgi:hypothetical protein
MSVTKVEEFRSGLAGKVPGAPYLSETNTEATANLIAGSATSADETTLNIVNQFIDLLDTALLDIGELNTDLANTNSNLVDTNDALTDNVARLDSNKVNIANGTANNITLTGLPIAPTAANTISNTQIATTEYVKNVIGITTGNTTGSFALSNTSVRFVSLGVGVNSTGTPGEIVAADNITAYYSDKRLKENIKPITDALNKLKQLNGVYYTQNKFAETFGYKNYHEQVGVIAQEVQEVLPHVVKLAPFDMDSNKESISGENYLTVQYDKLIPLLIEAIKEQQKLIESLELKVSSITKE